MQFILEQIAHIPTTHCSHSADTPPFSISLLLFHLIGSFSPQVALIVAQHRAKAKAPSAIQLPALALGLRRVSCRAKSLQGIQYN